MADTGEKGDTVSKGGLIMATGQIKTNKTTYIVDGDTFEPIDEGARAGIASLKEDLTQGLLYKGYFKKDEDFNDYQETGIYEVNLSNADYLTLSNAPPIDMLESTVGLWLEVIHNSNQANKGILTQRITGKYPNFNKKYACISRYGNYTDGQFSFSNWTEEYYSAKGTESLVGIETGGAIPFAMESETKIPYSAKAGELFSFIISRGSFDTEGPTNLFFEGYLNGNYVANLYTINRPKNNDIGKLFVFTIPNEIDTIVLKSNKAPSAVINSFYGTVRIQQPYIINDIYNKTNTSRIFRVGANKEFTSILDAVIEAEKYKNSIVYIDSGTYDAVQEFKDRYGNDYFTKNNYYGQENYRGIPLNNGAHLVGIGEVIVTGGLDENVNQSAINWWSIFNAGDDTGGADGFGFTLENITLKVLNQYLRYAVHDEYGGSDYSYTNKYINCHFIMPTGVENKKCIGGGLGKHGYIVIDNCTIDAPSYRQSMRGINYHNNEDAGSCSSIYVKNCYIPNGTVGITWYGQTLATEKSIMYVNNCYLQNAPIKQAETQESTIENVDVISWNNEIGQ